MFDSHIHSLVSYDGRVSAQDLAQAAVKAGLKEICFADHLDYDPAPNAKPLTFDTEDYNAAYDHLEIPGLTIHRGFEFGMLPDNVSAMKKDLQRRPFDFVLGSVHFVDGIDIYYKEYWDKHPKGKGEKLALETTLACIEAHDDFDVLAHLTFMSKCRGNPDMRAVPYDDYRSLFDQILRTLVKKEKGLEINTSGVDRCGYYLPSAEYLLRFKALGGKIVTVGSDAHDPERVGQYCNEACQLVKDIFDYVCTFENRRPIFHK